MSFTKFLTSRVFLRHSLVAAIVFIGLIALTLQGLKKYTRHGETYPVPDFSGLTLKEAEETAKQHNLRMVITDSTHARGVAPGAVVDQIPEFGFKVKENRTVFLTINSSMPEQVTLPKLTNISFRQAQVLIENCGLIMGKTIYKPSEYNDLVLMTMQDSLEVQPGDKLIKGSNVDLVVGRNRDNLTTDLPNLTGLSVILAKKTLSLAMLNTGVVIFDESIISSEDSLSAKVWKQSPNSNTSNTLKMGSSVDFWVTVDSLKLSETMEPEL